VPLAVPIGSWTPADWPAGGPVHGAVLASGSGGGGAAAAAAAADLTVPPDLPARKATAAGPPGAALSPLPPLPHAVSPPAAKRPLQSPAPPVVASWLNGVGSHETHTDGSDDGPAPAGGGAHQLDSQPPTAAATVSTTTSSSPSPPTHEAAVEPMRSSAAAQSGEEVQLSDSDVTCAGGDGGDTDRASNPAGKAAITVADPPTLDAAGASATAASAGVASPPSQQDGGIAAAEGAFGGAGGEGTAVDAADSWGEGEALPSPSASPGKGREVHAAGPPAVREGPSVDACVEPAPHPSGERGVDEGAGGQGELAPVPRPPLAEGTPALALDEQ
jgi:hypothetical protein